MGRPLGLVLADENRACVRCARHLPIFPKKRGGSVFAAHISVIGTEALSLSLSAQDLRDQTSPKAIVQYVDSTRR